MPMPEDCPQFISVTEAPRATRCRTRPASARSRRSGRMAGNPSRPDPPPPERKYAVKPRDFRDKPVETNAPSADEVKYTTCYMCACRCGIKVHLKDGGIRYIEGNRNHPVNRGVLCGKGAAGIMQHYSP